MKQSPRSLVKTSAGFGAVLLVAVVALGSLLAQEPTGGTLSWAYPEEDKVQPAGIAEDNGPRNIPGSTRTFSRAEAASPINPPDWFPDQHPPAPQIINKGHGVAWGCGGCHLMTGLGHPEHADLTGLTTDYLIQQMMDFKSGVRKDPAKRMNEIAAALTDEELRQSSEWFTLLTPVAFTKVIEATTVPKTYFGQTRMRLIHPAGGTEPLGDRIVSLPQDEARTKIRDPHSGYNTYVPVGSIAKGEALVQGRGCTICHGDALEGVANVPRIAGQHALYIARQLRDFQMGDRNGKDAALMDKAVAKLTDADILAISAYVAAQPPPAIAGGANR